MYLAVPSCHFPLSVVLGGGRGLGRHSCRLVAASELIARFAPSILYLRQYQSQKVFVLYKYVFFEEGFALLFFVCFAFLKNLNLEKTEGRNF